MKTRKIERLKEQIHSCECGLDVVSTVDRNHENRKT